MVPTGHVVGVLQRNWRDYVASFSQEDQSISKGKASERVRMFSTTKTMLVKYIYWTYNHLQYPPETL